MPGSFPSHLLCMCCSLVSFCILPIIKDSWHLHFYVIEISSELPFYVVDLTLSYVVQDENIRHLTGSRFV